MDLDEYNALPHEEVEIMLHRDAPMGVVYVVVDFGTSDIVTRIPGIKFRVSDEFAASPFLGRSDTRNEEDPDV